MNRLLAKPNTHESIPSARSLRTSHILLRLLRARQPISRIELAGMVGFNRSTVTSLFKPLIAAGLIREMRIPGSDSDLPQGRPRVGLGFDDTRHYFLGVNLGVRHSQVGAADLNGEMLWEAEYETPPTAEKALSIARDKIDAIRSEIAGRELMTIGVSVPGLTDPSRKRLLFAPNLKWTDVDLAKAFEVTAKGRRSRPVPVIVENDSTAAAMFEVNRQLRQSSGSILNDFIVVRSGTGIGVGLVIDGEVYRGSGEGRGIAGEFGHMTIVANGKLCPCGNRGCWERYASAASSAELYVGDHTKNRNQIPPRFVEIVTRAEAGETRAKRTLEQLGEYLGIGMANVILGIGVSNVIMSGRLVYGWKFINGPMNRMIERSIVGRLSNWSILCGEPKGSAIGGAIEVAIEEFMANHLTAEK